MHKQRESSATKRCERHGLVANNDGACPVCVAQARAAKRTRMVVLVTLVAVGGAIVPALWRFASPSPSAAPTEENVQAPTHERHAGLDFSQMGLSHSPGSARAVPEPAERLPSDEDELAPRNLEDGHLGEVALQPTTSRLAPPAPPRASVDPEPQPPDDPRDFDLPRRQDRDGYHGHD